MSTSLITIRPATPDDAEALLSIYAPYVEHTAITFEYEVPSVEEFRERIVHTLQLYPYIVAERRTASSATAISKTPEHTESKEHTAPETAPAPEAIPTSDVTPASDATPASDTSAEIVGYAYAGPLHARAAYAWSVETSIYVKESEKKSGIGKTLYLALEKVLAAQNITNVNACIASPVVDDEYLNRNSIQFHEHFGYSMVGEFHKCAYKFGRWYNMVWMEKIIAEHQDKQPPMIPFPELILHY